MKRQNLFDFSRSLIVIVFQTVLHTTVLPDVAMEEGNLLTVISLTPAQRGFPGRIETATEIQCFT